MEGSRRIPWLVFIVGVIAVVDVLGWVSWRLVTFERQQQQSREEAARQEAIGRALWRMDSIVLPLLAVESARPYWEYQAFYPANRPADEMWVAPQPGDVLVPSPLLGEPGDLVRLHFERDGTGRLTSPQAPAGDDRIAAVAAGVPEMLLSMADIRLYELDRLERGDDSTRSAGELAEFQFNLGSALPPIASTFDVDNARAVAPHTVLAINPDLQMLSNSSPPNDMGQGGWFAGALSQPAVASQAAPDAGSQRDEASPLRRSLEPEAAETAANNTPAAARGELPATPEALATQADLRQDYEARQQAVTNAQNLNDAARLNRGRGYDGSRTGSPAQSSAAAPAGSPGSAPEFPAPENARSRSEAANEAQRDRAVVPVEPTPTLTTPPAESSPPAEAAREGASRERAAPPATGATQELAAQTQPTSHAGGGSEPGAQPGQPAGDQRLGLGNANPQPPTPTAAAGAALSGIAENQDAESTTPTPLESDATNSAVAPAGARSDDPLNLDRDSLGRPEAGPLSPTWRGPQTAGGEGALVLVRRVTVAGETREQGVWIDWPALRRNLEASVADLFPLAEVQPLAGASNRAGASEAQRLATIPVVLIPGPLAAGILPPSPGFWTPTRWTLLVGWIAVAIAVIAIGVVLRKAIDLGERRGRFVSAVTHELRTPLTTFRLYSQLLAGGAVNDESKRARYAQTLDRESQRLSGIVESVLEYARLGRRAAPAAARQRLDTAAIIERIRPALAGRADRAGMQLAFPEPDATPAASVQADPDKIERILLNLVDNACKYASDAPDRRIILDATVRDDRLILGVRDFGPGVPPDERRRIFHAFHRAKLHEASANPGLGLGLALSRGLAREMGGDLRLIDSSQPGARFELSLPVA